MISLDTNFDVSRSNFLLRELAARTPRKSRARDRSPPTADFYERLHKNSAMEAKTVDLPENLFISIFRYRFDLASRKFLSA